MLQETQTRLNRLLSPKTVYFVLKGGGIGDYIAWLPALVYVAKHFPHVKPTIFYPPYFQGIAENVFAPYSQVTVRPIEELKPEALDTIPTFIPISSHPKLANLCPINGHGAHLIDMGFMYFLNKSGPPAAGDGFYPQLDLADTPDPLADNGAHFPIAVMTPGHTAPNRMMPADVFNDLKRGLIERGLTPVFLGRTYLTAGYNAYFNQGYDYSGGVDLIDETSLMETAKIISKAKVIVGLDNGLIHLAGMTETPIVVGYNIMDPKIRIPRRERGAIKVVEPNADLPCRFCQSDQRFLFMRMPDGVEGAKRSDHICLIETFECLKQMTAAKYLAAVDGVLNATPN